MKAGVDFIEKLRPTQRERVMDLVAAAGVDVSQWQNIKSGAAKAATNPKYCYNWSFLEPGKVAVLNLWVARLQEQDGQIFQSFNMREMATQLSKASWKKRALEMDQTILESFEQKIPVRVILCDGMMRDIDDPEQKASVVKTRQLDESVWAISFYDKGSGDCTAVRGPSVGGYVDQYTIGSNTDDLAKKREVSGTSFIRDRLIRDAVLRRAGGHCEYCKTEGFVTADGRKYLETHHVILLSRKGSDSVRNVVALCANHHREAHYGANTKEMQIALLRLCSG
ncbi:MAG: HNH endonuclease [Hyphomicrobiales bacterium]|nr:HNH endonuclease [Hyphomicrobiales bacterium]